MTSIRIVAAMKLNPCSLGAIFVTLHWWPVTWSETSREHSQISTVMKPDDFRVVVEIPTVFHDDV
jgi:hypothetical protein